MGAIDCVINEETNIVENVIVLGDSWTPPEGYYHVISNVGTIGMVFDPVTQEFSTP